MKNLITVLTVTILFFLNWNVRAQVIVPETSQGFFKKQILTEYRQGDQIYLIGNYNNRERFIKEAQTRVISIRNFLLNSFSAISKEQFVLQTRLVNRNMLIHWIDVDIRFANRKLWREETFSVEWEKRQKKTTSPDTVVVIKKIIEKTTPPYSVVVKKEKPSSVVGTVVGKKNKEVKYSLGIRFLNNTRIYRSQIYPGLTLGAEFYLNGRKMSLEGYLSWGSFSGEKVPGFSGREEKLFLAHIELKIKTPYFWLGLGAGKEWCVDKASYQYQHTKIMGRIFVEKTIYGPLYVQVGGQYQATYWRNSTSTIDAYGMVDVGLGMRVKF